MNHHISFDLIQDDLVLVEEKMLLQADEDFPDLHAALVHLLKSGGKRTRPTLTLLVGNMLGGKQSQLVTLAAAIEMLHTATLVHDDLIDSSLLRRGIPTLNSQWSPAATVLTGDYLFAKAAKMAAEADSLPAMRLFSQTLATIVNGEITQMFSKTSGMQMLDRSAYKTRIDAKTASLFRTSTTVAALVSPVDSSIVNAVSEYGYYLGMAFQIVDDVLDFTAEQEKVGKPVGSDIRQGLITLPTIYYFESLKTDEARQKALAAIEKQDSQIIGKLIDEIRTSPACSQSLDEARRYIEKAVELLPLCPENVYYKALMDLAWFIVDRQL